MPDPVDVRLAAGQDLEEAIRALDGRPADPRVAARESTARARRVARFLDELVHLVPRHRESDGELTIR